MSAITVLLLLLIGAAGMRDIVARTVPGWTCLAVAGLGLVLRLRAGEAGASLIAASIVFMGAGLCWRRGWLGGGDVKLLAACALSVPPHAVPGMIATTAIAGALLAALYLAARRFVRPPLAPRPVGLLARAARAERWRMSRGGPLPYAVAIAIGAAWVLVPLAAAPPTSSAASPDRASPAASPERAAAIANLPGIGGAA